MKKLIWIIIILVIAIGIWSSLSTPQGKNTITVGVINPMTGPAGNLGEDVWNAMRLASTTSLKLILEDDQCDTKKAVSAYQKLKLEGVKIFSVSCSGSVMALAPLAKDDGNLIITGFAGSAEIRKTGDEVIRFTPDAISIAEAMAEYTTTLSTSTKIGLLYEEQDYSKSAAELLKQKLGSRITAEERYTATDSTFRTQLTKLKGAGIATLLYIPTSDKAAQLIYKEMKTLGFTPAIIGDVNVCEYPFAPKEFGLTATCFDFGFSTERPAYREFLGAYRTAYGKDPIAAYNDAVTYDSLYAVDMFAQNYTGKDLVPDLKKFLLSGVEGRMSTYTFTLDGEVVSEGNLKKLER